MKQLSVNETTSVYVCGFPLDFEEEDLSTALFFAFFPINSFHFNGVYCLADVLFSPHGKIKRIKLYRNAEGKLKGDALITFTRPDIVPACCLKVRCFVKGLLISFSRL